MGKFCKNSVQVDAEETALRSIIEEQKTLIAKQSEIIARQERTIKLLQKAGFGQKSEKIIDTDERQRVFEDILNEVDRLNPPATGSSRFLSISNTPSRRIR
ncbi:MAG: hypothetical protein PHI85_11240 [Victivallaceae bacterium]|jgi:hypothetical protein|nr:hypothetical protein [Victivallaceae bacterium]